MAARHERDDNDATVAPLSRLDEYEVADGSTDVRGWTVIATDDRPVGRVDDLIVDTGRMDTRFLLVELTADARESSGDDAASALVPVERVGINRHGRQVRVELPSAMVAALPRYRERDADRAAAAARREQREGDRSVTRSAENLRIGRRRTVTGEDVDRLDEDERRARRQREI